MGESRQPTWTYDFIDEHCQMYRQLFNDIRSFEAFKFLIIGMLLSVRPKKLSKIAQTLELKEGKLHQALLSQGWQVARIRSTRLNFIQQHIGEQAMVLCISERFCGRRREKTDYVCLQENKRLGKARRGMISINAYGIADRAVYPLAFQVFKPRSRLEPNDQYKTKSEIALELIREISKAGFRVELILTDSLHDEETDFISVIEQLNLPYIIAVHRRKDALFASEQLTHIGDWRTYNLLESLLKSQLQGRIREVKIKHFKHHCYEVPGSTFKEGDQSEFDFIYSDLIYSDLSMTRLLKVAKKYCWWAWMRDYYELPNWTLGWEDFQFDNYFRIERWWEIVFGAYLVATLWAHRDKAQSMTPANNLQKSMNDFPFHPRLRGQVEIKN
ncbi:transposase [Leptolyngbya sp. AN03gr2]|uniref:transposase n=1 Tax=unclassified Leptolyngbya TaxID=2650499 RepID=UPI003D3177A8